jgi:hypothetical protein
MMSLWIFIVPVGFDPMAPDGCFPDHGDQTMEDDMRANETARETRMTTKRKEAPVPSKTVAPRAARTLAGKRDRDNLPPVSKQTAGGIAGAAIGGIVAGPVGAIVGGVAGALLGNASAAGERPLERTVDGIRAVAEEPARRAYKRISAAIARHRVSSKKKAATKKTAAKALAAKKSSKAGK